MGIATYSKIASQNSSISGINIAEGCAASGINNAIRQLMADLAAGYFSVAISGAERVDVSGNAAATLTPTQAAGDILDFHGALTGAISVNFPQAAGIWFVRNRTTGGKVLTMTMPTGAAAVSPTTGNFILLSDGTDMFLAETGVVTQGAGNSTSAPASTAFTTGAINTEAFARGVGDTLLGNALTAETTRAEAAENTLLAAGNASVLALQTINALPSYVLWEDSTNHAANSTIAGSSIGSRPGTWRAMGNASIGSGFYVTLFVRIR